jgi:dienelactone hydrolase
VNAAPDDVLAGWTRTDHAYGGRTRPVWRRGSGPAVIVIHEMPGLHPLVVRFAERVVDAGMTVYLPSLFGQPGRPVTPLYAAREMLTAICVRREFSVWAADRSSPIVDWLRDLARVAHADCGGRGVGAVGMCFTGGFALAMMTEPAVVAPVLSQPSQPLAMGFGKAKRACSIDATPDERRRARERMEAEDLKLLGLRFRGDPFVPDERFELLAREFGERFEDHTLDPADAGEVEGNDMAPHSVLTLHLDETDPDGPTKRVERRVIEFFREATAAPEAPS